MLGTDVVIAMRRMRIDAVINGSSGNEMEQELCDAGADWVGQTPISSNETIIQRIRAALPRLDLATADTFQSDDLSTPLHADNVSEEEVIV
jgi:hypothetical protein